MRILIAEDDFTSRSMLAAVLRKSGYDVVETSNGSEAWREMEKPDAPRIAVLDWVMPEMDGLEVVRRVRALQTEQLFYIIILTTKGEKADMIAGLDAGADDYLAKPFHPGELRARVEVGRRMIEMQDKLIKSREALAHEATHDYLTGILNRRAILDRLKKELARAGRHGDALAIGVCDIDHFKKINDTYGHQTGDDVLCELSQIMNDCSRNYDSVGRIGGEEFLIIIPMKAGTDPVSAFNRLCMEIAGSIMKTRSGDLFVTVSIGVACATAESLVDEILGAADAALYQAKVQGRNRVVYAAGRIVEEQPK
ncbi:MAG: diguanylate cyclase [Proteobacteria bacterium]|nr:diguanylate cyclase [Pseudomonadota bacterium]